MEHHEAIRLMDAAADGRIDPTERTALEEHLYTCPTCRAYAAELAALDERLQRALHSSYPLTEADAKAISAVMRKIQARNRRRSMTQSAYRTVAWTALAALFIVAVGWSIRMLLPRPAARDETPGIPPATASPAAPLPTQTQPPADTPTPPSAEGLKNALFPNVQFEMAAEMPAAPEQVNIYIQELPEPVSLDAIRQMAARLGLEAPVYQRAGEGPQPIYVVTDGFRTLTFHSGTAEGFDYVADYSQVLSNHGPSLPFEQIFPSAVAFLDESGLMEGNLLAERLPNQINGVRLSRTLEGRPVIFGVGKGHGGDLEVILDAEGKVSQASYFPLRTSPTGLYPILSAQQAWEGLLSGEALDRLRYGVSDVSQPGTLETWQRSYPTGETIHLYGYASVMQPAEGGGAPLVQFNNLPVTGANAASFASQASPYEFWHAWGQLQADEQGRLAFAIEGWEVSPLEDKYLQGTIRGEGDRAILATNEGDFELPELPAEVPLDAFAEARGVLASPGVLDWSVVNAGTPASTGYSMIEACMGGGGGGGGNDFGGGSFRQVSLQPVTAGPTFTPTAQTAPFQPGEAVEAATGMVTAVQHISADGSSQMEFYFSGDPIGAFSESWAAHLVGDGTSGLVDLNALPVRIWGHVSGTGSDGWPEIQVDRFEEVYPGLRFQAWVGTWQSTTLEGKEVLLFTTLDGEQFVLSTSIDYGTSAATGLQGDRVIIEGLVFPGKTFGGYPVITEYASTVMTDEPADLSGYEITSNRPSIFDEHYSEAAQNAALQGLARVEKVELVYATASLTGCRGMGLTESDPQVAPWLIVQPVWRFSGTFEDGRTFEIQVQALAEEYLR